MIFPNCNVGYCFILNIVNIMMKFSAHYNVSRKCGNELFLPDCVYKRYGASEKADMERIESVRRKALIFKSHEHIVMNNDYLWDVVKNKKCRFNC